MKLSFQLAYKNLIGAGLRTWLNVGVLAFSFIIIIFYNGLLEGWHQQAKLESIDWEFGSGHILHKNYDPYDSFTLLDGHGKFSSDEIKNLDLTPILIWPGSIYPNGRMLSVLIKGISPNQTQLKLPTKSFSNITYFENKNKLPMIIGKRMAEISKLKIGDLVLLRWRDQNGTFDAASFELVQIFKTDVATVDIGQIWIPMEKLWKMTGLTKHATFWVGGDKFNISDSKFISGIWKYQSQVDLLKNLEEIIAMEKISASFIYFLLLAIALLAIFDTQVLSVFRRQKEIGTYIALGMTRYQVVRLFTVEGSVYSFFAMIIGCIVGIPIFIYFATSGISFPKATQEMGVVMAQTIFPIFGLRLIISTVLLVVVSATIVSFLPAKKIARMNPVEALKGKLQ